VVVEVGGGLRGYRVAGTELLDGYGEEEMCSGGRGQLLAPWPNRLRDGRYEFEGVECQTALTEPQNSNAMHGLVRFANWVPAHRGEDQIVMQHRLHPQPGYPFALDLELEYVLSDEGLSARCSALNVGRGRCPYGAGSHPYLTIGTPTIDDAILCSPGRLWMPTDERQIPTGTEQVEGTRYDFRAPRVIGSTQLDTGYADLERSSDGRARVTLRHPDQTRGVVLWMDAGYRYLMLFTGDSLGEHRRRRGGLAVEPMTCAPNAFQSGEGLMVLEPGERFTSSWGIAVL
jgi:aldose 1-epimerase